MDQADPADLDQDGAQGLEALQVAVGVDLGGVEALQVGVLVGLVGVEALQGVLVGLVGVDPVGAGPGGDRDLAVLGAVYAAYYHHGECLILFHILLIFMCFLFTFLE